MKKYISRLAAALMVISLVACSEQGQEGIPSGVNRPLQISDAAAGISASVTRAGRQELNQATDAIGLFLEGSSEYAAVINRKFTYATPVWKTEGGEIILGAQTANLFAYYPFDENQTTKNVILESGAYAPEKELYYQSFQASYSSSRLSLNLERAYALIRFSIIRGEADAATGAGAYHGDGVITAFQFTTQAIERASLDMQTTQLLAGPVSTVTLVSEAPEVPFAIGTMASPTQKNFLMVPVTFFPAPLSFTAVVDGKTMTGSVSPTDLSGQGRELKAGYVYEIKIVVRPTGLVVEGTGISQEAWDVKDINGELEIQ